MNPNGARSPPRGELATVWSALAAASLAVGAWSACCVAPLAFSLAGLGLAGASGLARQRDWLTLGAAALVAGGWWLIWRRRRACAVDARCAQPGRLTLGVLSLSTVLTLAAFAWPTFIEPWALHALRAARG